MVPRYVQAGLGKSPSDITGILSTTSNNLVAIAYSIGDTVRAAANGTRSASPGGDPVALPTQGIFSIGADNTSALPFNGYIQKINIYPYSGLDNELVYRTLVKQYFNLLLESGSILQQEDSTAMKLEGYTA